MIQKKICLVGAFAVGKTSLVQRFVTSIFSDKYLTTVGVKIDKKPVEVDGRPANLILWDMAGEDEVNKVRMTYMRGASGYLLVVDGTRPYTLETAVELRQRIEKTVGKLPVVLLLNKCDLQEEWRLEPGAMDELIAQGWTVLLTSAKTGQGVEEAFTALAREVIGG